MQSSYEINENIMMFATEYEIHIERTQAHMAYAQYFRIILKAAFYDQRGNKGVAH